MKIQDTFLYAVSLGLAYAMPLVAHAAVVPTDVQPVDTGLDSEKLKTLLTSIAEWIFNIAIIVAVIWIIIAGLRFLFAGGDSEKADKAKTSLLNGVIGLAVIIGVTLIVRTVLGLVTNVSSTRF